MSIAKFVPNPASAPPPAQPGNLGNTLPSSSDSTEVPRFLAEQFGIHPDGMDEKTRIELRDIYEDVSDTLPPRLRTPGNISHKVATLICKLGAPRYAEPAHRKLHTYLRLTKIMTDTKKQIGALGKF